MDNIIVNFFQVQSTDRFSWEAFSVIIAAISVFFAVIAFFWNLLSIRKKNLIEWLSKIESDLQAFDNNFLDHFRLSAIHLANNQKLKYIKGIKVNKQNKLRFLQILQQMAEESISYAKKELPESFKAYKIAEYNIRWDYPVSYHFFDKIRRFIYAPIEANFISQLLRDVMFSIHHDMTSNNYTSEIEYIADLYNKIIEHHSRVLKESNHRNFTSKISELYYIYLDHIHKGSPYKVWRISHYEKKLCRKHRLDEITEFTFEELLRIQKKYFKQKDFEKMLLLWNEAKQLMNLQMMSVSLL